MRSGVALALALLAAAPAVGAERSPAETWLLSAAMAPRRVSFTGVKDVILWSEAGAQGSTVEVAHRAPTGVRLTYRSTVGRAQRIVVDDGRRRWQYEPSAHVALISPSITEEDVPLSARRLGLLLANYRPAIVGREPVAGRVAVALTVRPRTDARPWLKLWVDEATGLVLRTELYHANGRLAEASAFTRIGFVSPPESLFQFRPPAGVTVRAGAASTPVGLPDLARRVGFTPIALERLPDGFVLDRVRLAGSGAPVAVMQYTDGLATLTLFQRPVISGARSSLPAGRPIPLGTGAAEWRRFDGTNVLHWQRNGLALTLVGEVPAAELTRIAVRIGVDGPPRLLSRLRYWLVLLWERLTAAVGS
jgi:negative regulator of sigma E activity